MRGVLKVTNDIRICQSTGAWARWREHPSAKREVDRSDPWAEPLWRKDDLTGSQALESQPIHQLDSPNPQVVLSFVRRLALISHQSLARASELAIPLEIQYLNSGEAEAFFLLPHIVVRKDCPGDTCLTALI